MKKKTLAALLLFLCLLLLLLKACRGPKLADTPWEGEVNTREDVTMEIVEATVAPDSLTVSITSTSEAEINSGNKYNFSIQMEKDGEWYALKEGKPKDSTSESIVYSGPDIGPGYFTTLNLTWADRYGELPKGHYRVVKSFSEVNPEGPPHTSFLLAAEFTLD